MSKYTSFAVIGAGGIGKFILEALLALNVSVVVITRPGSTTAESLPKEVKVVVADYTDAASFGTIFKEHSVEVVISTVAGTAIPSQNLIGDAAKSAGVKLFVPSEFGVPTDTKIEGFLGYKYEVAEHLKSIGLPSARFYTGFFTDVVPFITGFLQNGKINLSVSGTELGAFTAKSDIGGFVAHVLTTLPPSELDNTVFRIEGERTTLAGLGPIFKTEVVYVDEVPGLPEVLQAAIKVLIHVGSTTWDSTIGKGGEGAGGSSNGLWEGHHWKTIKETLNL